jgi:hypothetical protein
LPTWSQPCQQCLFKQLFTFVCLTARRNSARNSRSNRIRWANLLHSQRLVLPFNDNKPFNNN